MITLVQDRTWPLGSDKMTSIDELRSLFAKAEETLEKEGRDAAKVLLPEIYNSLICLNKWDKADWSPMTWRSEGELTETEFNELNLRRRLLSNSIGIKMADGTIRHDVNPI